MRLAGLAKGGYYPTPTRVVSMIADLMYGATGSYRTQDVLRILDPCCGAGDAVAQLAGHLRPRSSATIETYGVELHEGRAEEARGRLDHTLGVDLFQTSIANGAFGLAWLNPPYDWDTETRRLEHRFLTSCTRYLSENGLLVFIVPKHRLAVSARYLASHYRRLECWTFPEPEYEVFDQVVVFGFRKGQPSLDEYSERLVKGVVNGRPRSAVPKRLSDVPASDDPGW